MTATLMTPQELETGRAGLLALRAALGRVLLGQDAMLDLVAIALAARGHLLLEGLPGLGKTELVKALGSLLGLSFRRVQFTPDLLPSDITGGPILQDQGGRRALVFQPGPAVRATSCSRTRSTARRPRRSRRCSKPCRSAA